MRSIVWSKSLVFSAMILAAAVLTGCAAEQVAPEWTPVKITAKGSGAPPPTAVNPGQARLMAQRAAKADAMRNLIEQAYGVSLSSHTTVRDFVTQNDTIKAKVNNFMRGARVVDTRYLDDGSVEVEMELVLGDAFRAMFP